MLQKSALRKADLTIEISFKVAVLGTLKLIGSIGSYSLARDIVAAARLAISKTKKSRMFYIEDSIRA